LADSINDLLTIEKSRRKFTEPRAAHLASHTPSTIAASYLNALERRANK
jgi:hypothetical protein